jgi:TetR/AcrR family transcriptional regulator, fatty acid metabolism regulator protein
VSECSLTNQIMIATQFSERQIEIIEAATHRIDAHGIQDLTIKTLAADLGLSEAALYRHFKSKNEILLGLLTYFIEGTKARTKKITSDKSLSAPEMITAIYQSQLKAFVDNPSIVSVLFSESIFQFNEELSKTVSGLIHSMQGTFEKIIKQGQEEGILGKDPDALILTTIIMGGMRFTVLKWKLSGHRTDLIKDGNKVLSGIFKLTATGKKIKR